MINQTPVIVLCRHCEKPLRGRIDKKYCDDRCRNNYNNQVRGSNDRVARHINSILGRNRRILKELYQARKFRVKKATLLQLGYQSHYHTHRISMGRGRACIGNYDYGVVSSGRDNLRILSLG